MKARIPKEYHKLPKHQQDKLIQCAKDIAKEAAEEQLNKDMRLMLDLYMKMVCTILHDAFGFGEQRLTLFLGNHKRLFDQQLKLAKDNTQIAYLNKRMAEIFKKDGFPQKFFDDILGEVETT